MPAEFLTPEQARRYGRYNGDPAPAQLANYFFLDDNDRAEVASHRGTHNRLGYAIQLCTVRFLGTFLPEPTDVPWIVVKHLAEQLEIPDANCLGQYRERLATHHTHAREIRERHGYRDFAEEPEHWRLVRWLYTRAWLSAERPIVLFDLATARMTERGILLPGVTTLERLIGRIRDRTAARLWKIPAQAPHRGQRQRLQSLLCVAESTATSALDQLRKPPVYISAPGMVDALLRLKQFRNLGLEDLSLQRVPLGRLKVLARYAAAAKAQAIARMPPDRRLATLLAFAVVYETEAQDDAVDVLNQLISLALREPITRARRSVCGPSPIWTGPRCACGRPCASCWIRGSPSGACGRPFLQPSAGNS